ncbi:MAG: hypothetical protein IT230_00835 [Flavobacteriales bacterium]|nr:hypothetical protein [Flavobacteriales bacterium]
MTDLNTLLVDLDTAVHLSAHFTGGYSGEYLSAEDFHKDLSEAVVKLKAGDTSVMERLLWWFAPTCEWDDFITEGGVDLGNRIYSSLLKLNITDRPGEQHGAVR